MRRLVGVAAAGLRFVVVTLRAVGLSGSLGCVGLYFVMLASRLAFAAKALGFHCDILSGQWFCPWLHKSCQPAGLNKGQSSDCGLAIGLQSMSCNALEAGIFGFPGEGLSWLDFSHTPDCGGYPGLADARLAARAEFAFVEAFDGGDGRGPFGPSLDVDQDGPYAVRGAVDDNRGFDFHTYTPILR